MKVLVTGGCGFIGTALVKKLISLGHYVQVIDIKRECPIQEAVFFHGSICDYPTLYGAMKGVDVVFHLAAIASVQASIDDPKQTFKTNVEGTISVLETARETKVKKVMIASSAAVYNGDFGVKYESDPPSPLSPYALSKLVDEQYCTVYSELYSLPTVCLRFFNVYGNGMNPNAQYALAVAAFMKRMQNGQPLTVYGDGEQTRDYVYIDDVVDASIFAIGSEMQGVYNVGTGMSTSINRLAELISDKKCQIIHEATRPGEARFARANIDKLIRAGFTPQWSLEAGITKLKELQGVLV
jgi:UDP-glucose 4-epimerase